MNHQNEQQDNTDRNMFLILCIVLTFVLIELADYTDHQAGQILQLQQEKASCKVKK